MNLFSKENLEKESFKGNFCRTCSALIPALDPMALATCKPWAVSATLAKDGQGWETPRPGACGEGVPCPGGQLVVPQGPRGQHLKGEAGLPLGQPRALCRVTGQKTSGLSSCVQTVPDQESLSRSRGQCSKNTRH